MEEVIIERRTSRRRLAEAVAPSAPLARDTLSGQVVAASFAHRDAGGVDFGKYFGVRTPVRPSRTFDIVWACTGIPDRVVVDQGQEFATNGFLRSADALGITVQFRPGFPRRGA